MHSVKVGAASTYPAIAKKRFSVALGRVRLVGRDSDDIQLSDLVSDCPGPF